MSSFVLLKLGSSEALSACCSPQPLCQNRHGSICKRVLGVEVLMTSRVERMMLMHAPSHGAAGTASGVCGAVCTCYGLHSCKFAPPGRAVRMDPEGGIPLMAQPPQGWWRKVYRGMGLSPRQRRLAVAYRNRMLMRMGGIIRARQHLQQQQLLAEHFVSVRTRPSMY